MKLRKGMILLTTLIIGHLGYGQHTTTQDSIKVFYDSLFERLETQYLKRKEVNWESIKPWILNNAYQQSSFKNSLDVSATLFDTIGCDHCKLFVGNESISGKPTKSLTASDFSDAFISRLNDNSGFEFQVKLIRDKIGYINMPGMLLLNLSQDALNEKAQEIYNAILKLKESAEVNAWVIDLRYNIGGNAYVMLAGLYDLVGDQIVYKSLDHKGKPKSETRLKNGEIISGGVSRVKIIPLSKPSNRIPIALIMGKMTGSAGEDIAVAFINRNNVVNIGEPTYGLLTGNDIFRLPFEVDIALTLSFIADKNNHYRAFINPDIKVVKGDNFDDLTKDKNIIEALKFFEDIEER